ncbi:MAG: (2Fe-2S) ferredoxin domain-containing protein, partial [Thermosynechococcaceae cyanobacterium]
LRVGLATEHFQIKLPKPLRLTLPLSLTPETVIQVSGVGQLDTAKDRLKLKAHAVQSLAATPALPTTPATCPLATQPQPKPCAKILLCHKSGCQKRGGRQLSRILEASLRDRNLDHQVEIQYTGCQKRCGSAPNLTFMPGKHQYRKVNASHLPDLLDKHLN